MDSSVPGMTTHDVPTLLWPPVAGTEVDTLIGSLERQRRTFRWKCADLDEAGLRATTAASTMTLGGLLKHLALVESIYFTLRLHGRDPGAPWNSIDWDSEGPDWEWRSAADDRTSSTRCTTPASSAPGRTSPRPSPTVTRGGP